MIRLAVPACLALALALAACGGEECDLSAESTCGDPCAAGNELGVGMYCSVGGGECAETPNRSAPFCTVDQRPEADAFCTRPCDPDGDVVTQCGKDAECRGDGSGSPSGCVPIACL